MRPIRHNAILNLLIANGAALVLTVLMLSTLAAASKPAQAHSAPERTHPNVVAPPVQLPGQQAAIPSPSEVSTPTSILELFSPPYRPLGVDDLSAGDSGSLSLAASAGELGAAAVRLSTTPVFSWGVTGGTFSMDWGDVDRDGDLDLAVGGTNGTAVYLNDGDGGLTTRWSNTNYALGVRWADIIPSDSNLELIVVGQSSDGTSLGTGNNYFYVNPEATSPTSYTFEYNPFGPSPPAPQQIFRVVPGDYNNDGRIDLVVSTNATYPSATICPVLLYLNDGSGTYQFNNDPLTTPASPSCVSTEATASLSAADFDNDGDLDLALGRFQSKDIQIVEYDGTTPWPSVATVAGSLAHIPYDLSWGDYDRDGWLDLAAAFPFEQEARIYRNIAGVSFAPPIVIPTSSFFTPLAVDWADWNGDGRLDLAVAELPPRIYQYDGANFTVLTSLPALTGRIQSIRGIDLDNDADLDLALANQFGPSQAFETNASFLSPTLTIVDPGAAAQSVAWGDADGDGDLDLLFGADSESRLYDYNHATGNFESPPQTIGTGGQAVAFGDVDGDSHLDIAMANASEYEIYQNDGTGTGWSSIWSYASSASSKSLAWGYVNTDNGLDLLVGNDNGNASLAFLNDGLTPPTFSNSWSSNERETTYSVAWADYDGDNYLDFAVANGSRCRVYHNDYNNAFSSVWDVDSNARSVAWADYDNDGWLDLAVGNYGAANHVYENQNGTLADTSAWNSDDTSNTTSLAWGDWDNDGDFDLAIGNDGGRDQVYANLGAPNLVLLWESTEILATTAVAWGDKDGDGDLDLAISSGSESGVYENNYVLPAHLNDFTEYMPLPRHPSYVSIERPGDADDAYFFSSAEFLAGPATPGTVDIHYTLFDPDGDPIVQEETVYEFSEDGGGTWQQASPFSAPPWSGNTTRQGSNYTFVWDALGDGAGSDDARFRITIVHGKPTGPVQRASTRAVSPPFRVRATTCIWPAGPSIQRLDPLPPANPIVGDLTTYLGSVQEGSGTLNFTWDFGDGSPTVIAQLVNHRFTQADTYTVTLTVSACPNAPQVVTRIVETVEEAITGGLGGSRGPYSVHLPTVLKSGADVPAQVTGLQGSVQPDRGATHLEWAPSQGTDSVLGYRIYRGSRAATGDVFQLLDTVPADVHTYTDQTAACGQMYFVTAFDASGESLPSTASYFSPLCQ